MTNLQTKETEIKIDFGPQICNDTQYFKTGLRFQSTFIILKESGNDCFGRYANRAFHALNAYFNTWKPSLAKQAEFIQRWKLHNPQ